MPAASADHAVSLQPPLSIHFMDSFDHGELSPQRWPSATDAQVSGACGTISPQGALVLHGTPWSGSQDLDASAQTSRFYPYSGGAVSFWARLGGIDAEPWLNDLVQAEDDPCGDREGNGYSHYDNIKMQILGEYCTEYVSGDYTYYGSCTTETVWQGDPFAFTEWNYVEFALPEHHVGRILSLHLQYEGDYRYTEPFPSWVIDEFMVQSLHRATPLLDGGTPVPVADVDDQGGIRVYDARSDLTNPQDDGDIYENEIAYVPPFDPTHPSYGAGGLSGCHDPWRLNAQAAYGPWYKTSVYCDSNSNSDPEDHEQILTTDPDHAPQYFEGFDVCDRNGPPDGWAGSRAYVRTCHLSLDGMYSEGWAETPWIRAEGSQLLTFEHRVMKCYSSWCENRADPWEGHIYRYAEYRLPNTEWQKLYGGRYESAGSATESFSTPVSVDWLLGQIQFRFRFSAHYVNEYLHWQVDNLRLEPTGARDGVHRLDAEYGNLRLAEHADALYRDPLSTGPVVTAVLNEVHSDPQDQSVEVYWDQDGDGQNEAYEEVLGVENQYRYGAIWGKGDCIYEDINHNRWLDEGEGRICFHSSGTTDIRPFQSVPVSGPGALPGPDDLPGPSLLPSTTLRFESDRWVVAADLNGDGVHETDLAAYYHRGWGFTGLQVLGADVYQSPEGCGERTLVGSIIPMPWVSGEVAGAITYDACNAIRFATDPETGETFVCTSTDWYDPCTRDNADTILPHVIRPIPCAQWLSMHNGEHEDIIIGICDDRNGNLQPDGADPVIAAVTWQMVLGYDPGIGI